MDRLRPHPSRMRSGQSLVEFTILLPVLLIMLSGLIEFGFLLNTYLDLIDAAREAARFAASDEPNIGLPTDPFDPLADNFWHTAFVNSRGSLITASDGRIDWSYPDPFADCPVAGDIVVSAFAVQGNIVSKRYPLGDPDGASNCGKYQSKFAYAAGDPIYTQDLGFDSGVVLVEIYYEYEMLLGLPWITPFLPDPVVLHAYSFFPNPFSVP